MPEQSSSTQQLAAIDLVWQLALEHEMNATKTAVAVSVLRKFAEAQQERERAIGDALTARDVDLAWAKGAQLGAEVIAAVASVGAQIVWPSPDSGEVADGAAAGDTAPTTGHEGERPPGEPPVIGTPPGWYRTMGREWAAYHYGFPVAPEVQRYTASDLSVWEIADDSGEWWDLMEYAPGDSDRTVPTFTPARSRSAPGPKPTVREKILAEVAASTTLLVPDWASASQIRDEATTLAQAEDEDEGQNLTVSRANLVSAAGLLVLAVERLDGAR